MGSSGSKSSSSGGFFKNFKRNRTMNIVPMNNVTNLRIRGREIMNCPSVYKGRAFTITERQILGIHGLLPPNVMTQTMQVEQTVRIIRNLLSDLDRYIYMMDLHGKNEKLFFRVVMEFIEIMLPIIYTPTVGVACLNYSIVVRKPKGLFITIHDAGHVYEILGNLAEQNVKAIVVTDGERILGLGDLGCHGMGIPVSKMIVYTVLGGIKPGYCLPVMLDAGTNNETLLKDAHYLGLQHSRVSGAMYDSFVDEFMQAVVDRFGRHTLIQFEDFGTKNAFRFLDKYKNQYCMFNDDIQATASVVLAALLSSMRVTNKRLSDNVYVFQGAGSPTLGSAKLLVNAMEEEGTAKLEALKKIWLLDSKGLVIKSRPSSDENKMLYARDEDPLTTLEDVVKKAKPTVLIGANAIAGSFTEGVIRYMTSYCHRPVIFSLSSPTSLSECTAEQAISWSGGKCIFASGNPFPPVVVGEKTYYTSQANNSYIYPGLAMGVILSETKSISDKFFIQAAKTLSGVTTAEHLAEGRVFPPITQINDVSAMIASKIIELSYSQKVADFYPEPSNKLEFVLANRYSYAYDQILPETYEWPPEAHPLMQTPEK